MTKKRKPYTVETHDKYLRQYLKNGLRLSSIRWPAKNLAKNAARKERGKYECAMCKNLVRNGEFEMDHINPVIPLNNPEISIGEWVVNMFCRPEGYQLLCHTCHDIKSALESKLRTRKSKKNAKKS